MTGTENSTQTPITATIKMLIFAKCLYLESEFSVDGGTCFSLQQESDMLPQFRTLIEFHLFTLTSKSFNANVLVTIQLPSLVQYGETIEKTSVKYVKEWEGLKW